MGQIPVIRCFVQNFNAPPARSKLPLIFLSTEHVLLWQILNTMTHLAEIWVAEPQNNSKNNNINSPWVAWVKFQ